MDQPGTVTALLGALGTLDWADAPRAHRDTQALLARVEDPRSLVRTSFEWTTRHLERSVEKTTHYKWFVAADEDARFEVWLHDYKPRAQRRVGHAAVPHNHRFWFTSLLLRGGFASQLYEPREEDGAELVPTRRLDLRAGDTFVADPSEIHSLRDLEDGTLSLIVQSRPVSSYSTVYENGKVVRYRDLPAQHELFAESAPSLHPFGPDPRRHY